MISDETLYLQSQVNELKKNYEEVSSYNKSIEKFKFVFAPSQTSFVKSLNFKCFEKFVKVKFRCKQNQTNLFYINLNSVTIFKSSEKNFSNEFVLECNKSNTLEIYFEGETGTINVFLEIFGAIELLAHKSMSLVKLNSKYYALSDNGDAKLDGFESLEKLESGEGSDLNIQGFISNCCKYNLTEFEVSDSIILLEDNSKYYMQSVLDETKAKTLVLENGKAYAVFPILDATYSYGLLYKANSNLKIKYFKSDNTSDKEADLDFNLKFDIKKAGAMNQEIKTSGHYGFWFIDANDDAYIVFSKVDEVGETNSFYEPVYVGKSLHLNIYLYNNKILSFSSVNNCVVYSEYTLTFSVGLVLLTKTELEKYKNAEFGFVVADEKLLYSNGYLTYLK